MESPGTRRGRQGLADAQKPWGVFLFIAESPKVYDADENFQVLLWTGGSMLTTYLIIWLALGVGEWWGWLTSHF